MDDPSQNQGEALAQEHLAFWRRNLTQPCFVYIVQGDPGTPIKVGRAVDVEARIKGLQTGNPQPLHLLHVLPGDHKLETHLHHRMPPNHRIQGEWFRGRRVVPFLEYVGDLATRMVEAYDGSGVAPRALRLRQGA